MGRTNYTRRGEMLELNVVRYYRYPEAKQTSHRVYFQAHHAARKQGFSSYHVDLWKSVYASIPPKHHIHHRDENPLNNVIGNLECIPVADHIRQHHLGRSSE